MPLIWRVGREVEGLGERREGGAEGREDIGIDVPREGGQCRLAGLGHRHRRLHSCRSKSTVEGGWYY
jgi:hypothetical protein